MESDDPDCHHDIPRPPKPRADKDPPDPDLDDPGDSVDLDDHDDPDDLPDIPRFIFTSPRTRADHPPEEDLILIPAAMQTGTEQEDNNQQKKGIINSVEILIVYIQLLLQAEKEPEIPTYLRKRGRIGIGKDGELGKLKNGPKKPLRRGKIETNAMLLQLQKLGLMKLCSKTRTE